MEKVGPGMFWLPFHVISKLDLNKAAYKKTLVKQLKIFEHRLNIREH